MEADEVSNPDWYERRKAGYVKKPHNGMSRWKASADAVQQTATLPPMMPRKLILKTKREVDDEVKRNKY